MTTLAYTLNLPKTQYKIKDARTLKDFVPRRGLSDAVAIMIEALFTFLEWYMAQDKPVIYLRLVVPFLIAAVQSEVQIRYYLGCGITKFLIFLVTGDFENG